MKGNLAEPTEVATEAKHSMSELDAHYYGAEGIARPGRQLKLENLVFKWLHYPSNIVSTIYEPAPGKDYDSVGIQRAIDKAHASGGGTVSVPAGDYLIGPIELRSRVNLHLEPGCRLWASPNLADYQPTSALPSTAFPFNPAAAKVVVTSPRRLISAVEAEDVSITGFGQICAQSPNWVIPWLNSKPSTLDISRPSHTILFSRCQNVRIEGIRIVDAPSWGLVFDSCRQVQIRGVQIRGFDMINCDGIDLVNTSDVTISDCNLWVTDDGIVLKNFIAGQTMRNIVVTNCVIRTLCNGLKIGTETVGNVEDVTFSNVVVHNPDDDMKGAEGGVNVCAMDGGLIRNINVSNIVTRNVDCPVYLVSGHRASRQQTFRAAQSGRMERIFVSNIRSDGARYTSFIVGQPDQPIDYVVLDSIHVRKKADFYRQLPQKPVPERPEEYPTPFMFGSRGTGDQLPAHGLYLRHVQRASIRDLRVDCIEPDVRPLCAQENCKDVRIDGASS